MDMDINIDPSFSRTTNADMALGSSLGLDISIALEAAQATQISMAPVAAWPSDTNMAPGG